MALATETPQGTEVRELKRSVEVCPGVKPVYEPANKRRAVEPSPGFRNHPDILIPPFEASGFGSLNSEDSTYGYPELEDDMASIFDITSSLNSSGSAAVPSQESYGLSCPSDLHEIEMAFDSLVQPPSSVIRDHERLSPSRELFDPNLQYSSPDENEQSDTNQYCDEENALDEDVEWVQIMQDVKPLARKVSSFAASFASASSRSAPKSHPGNSAPSGAIHMQSPAVRVSSQQVSPAKSLLSRPFKTFFRIQDMLVHKADLYRHQPDAVFEIFARVVYTSRDKTGCRQYFQLRNLSSESPPFISGTLVD